MSQTESFRGYLQARGRSPITIDNYSAQVQNYLNSIGDADPFKAETVQGYLTRQRVERGLKPQSLRWTSYAIRTFFRANHKLWNVETGEDTFSKSAQPSTPILWVDKIDKLLAACAKFKPEGDDLYDPSLFYSSIVYLSAVLGPRRIELQGHARIYSKYD
jgi:site-specific recombinase XerC